MRIFFIDKFDFIMSLIIYILKIIYIVSSFYLKNYLKIKYFNYIFEIVLEGKFELGNY